MEDDIKTEFFPKVYKKEQEDTMRRLLGKIGYESYMEMRFELEQMNILRKELGMKTKKVSSKKLLKKLHTTTKLA